VPEKRRYLADVLRDSTNGYLDEALLQRILRCVSLEAQYAVYVFIDRGAYTEAIEIFIRKNLQIFVINDWDKSGFEAAIATPKSVTGTKSNNRAIFIYSPHHKAWRGLKC
jgi:hypothetical protein